MADAFAIVVFLLDDVGYFKYSLAVWGLLIGAGAAGVALAVV